MKIIDVTKDNVELEFDKLSKLAASSYCSYISIDTEFPGFICRTPLDAPAEQRYVELKFNVDAMKIIQLGFTLYDENGESLGVSWQISFKDFDPAVDLHATDSIQLLADSGVDFEKNLRDGVGATLLSRLLWRKLIFPRRGRTKWLSFHGLYDLGYVVKLLTQWPLPDTLAGFFWLVTTLLGEYVYDVKHMAGFYGFGGRLGLVKMAEKLGISLEGHRRHQAGHDSRLIGDVFWKLKGGHGLNEDDHVGIMHGVEECNSYRYHGVLMPTHMQYSDVSWCQSTG